MSIEDSRRFLPKTSQEDERLSKWLALIQRANATSSTIRILNDELRCNVPEYSMGKSWKFHCPWGFEHKDHGIEKHARYYWEDDEAFCFKDHGKLDPVGLRAMQWGMPKTAAAKRMLDEAGVLRRKNFRQRMDEMLEMQANPPAPVEARLTTARAALYESLSRVPQYAEHQFRPDVQETLQDALQRFDKDWGFPEVLAWVEESQKAIQHVLGCDT